VIGQYLSSSRAASILGRSFGAGGNRIRARTARNWLNKIGFTNGEVRKGVFVDGYERKDVVGYRNNVFLPAWKDYERRMVIFSEGGSWELPSNLQPDERPIVVTHDESIFNANNGKRKIWMKDRKQPIRPKDEEKE